MNVIIRQIFLRTMLSYLYIAVRSAAAVTWRGKKSLHYRYQPPDTPDMMAKRDFFTVSKIIRNFSSRYEKRNSRSCQINSLLFHAVINILFPVYVLAFASLLTRYLSFASTCVECSDEGLKVD